MIETIITVIFCFIVSFLLVPITINVAKHVNAISIPEQRHIHTKSMPLLGGLAIFLAFLLGFMMFAKPQYYFTSTLWYEVPAILIASILFLLVGIIDDINPVRARTKFVTQLLGAAVIIFYGNLRIDDLFGFLPDGFENVVSILLTFLWITAVTNAINLVDGLDGLSTGVSSIYFATVIALFYFGGTVEPFPLLLATLMLGSTLGFLPWNFPRARVFMGDAGSMFLGLMIAIIPLLGFKQVTLVSLFMPMMMMIVPVFEIVYTIIRRTVNQQSIGEADTKHIHHQLLRATNSPRKAVLIIWTVSLLFSIDAIILEVGNKSVGIVLFVVLVVISILILQLSKQFENSGSTLRKTIRRLKK